MLTLCFLLLAAAFATQHEHPVMGFDLAKTTHHFYLTGTGGRIDVTAANASDATSVTQIRTHLQHIAHEFADGRFDTPFQTHGEVPPGVAEMQSGKHNITYRYADLPQGGAVRILTKDAQSLNAVHAFLRYQITEHRTGDAIGSAP